MKTHELKISPKYYLLVSNGTKKFEVRLNDRDFKEGDTVILKEFNVAENIFTGCELTFKIGFVLNLGDFFFNENKFVVFSLIEPTK